MKVSKQDAIQMFGTFIFCSICLTLMLCSCGHNLGTVVHGKFVNIGYDPEINKIGIQYVDGIMMTGVNKELSKNKLKFTDTAEKGDVKTSTIVEYSNENGEQVTGYQVDAIEAAAELEKARQANAAAELEKVWKHAREVGPQPKETEAEAAEKPVEAVPDA